MVEFLVFAAIASAAVGFMTSETEEPDLDDDSSLPQDSDDLIGNEGSAASLTGDQFSQPDCMDPKSENSVVLPGNKADIIVTNSNPGGSVLWTGYEHHYSRGHSQEDFDLVKGTSEQEKFLVESGSAKIITVGGGDFVDASGMTSGIIISEGGDTILGSEIKESKEMIGIEIQGDGVILGGGAGESIVATGDGAEVSGGGGDDKILSVNGSAVLNGGDGDDYIDGAATVSEYSQDTRAISISNDAHSDKIDGGAGNDRINLSNGDVAKGGAGRDSFVAEFNFNTNFQIIEISDFDPSSESLLLQVQTEDPSEMDDDLFYLRGRIQSGELDGDTYVSIDGVPVLKLVGVIDLDLSGHEDTQCPIKIRHYLDERR